MNNSMIVASVSSFVALSLLFGVLLTGRRQRGAARNFERRLRLYTLGRGGKEQRSKGVLASSPVAQRAIGLVEKMPASRSATLQTRIEQAGWSLRASELMLIRMCVCAGAAIASGVLIKIWWAPIFGIAGYLAPKLILDRAVTKRSNAFLAQLPDTLQLVSGSLQAGYGLMQAVDTLVKESPAPTSVEFQRVLAETRLGMPLEDSLGAMAERIDSDDFRWVVMAIGIQRQVGGNLAQLLTTVANTLRDREAVRRTIKTLSAEGRLSAYILVVLPFAIAGYVATVNPQFIKVLVDEPIGRIMIGGALTLMGLGVIWMNKIIKIEV
ncbi:MAG: type II secretion system F family protein [Actinomycetota bacterium]